MTFWLALGLMTAAAMLIVVSPLFRRGPPPAAAGDMAVYRDQLAEIDRDLARGAIAPKEAEAARIEISRRLIAAAERADTAATAHPDKPEARAAARPWRIASIAALIALPLGAIAAYLALGSPELPGQPLAARLARGGAPVVTNDVTTLAALILQVEAHLDRNPDDARGWEVLAPAYMRLERYDEAVKARSNAIRLLGATAERVSALGEAVVAAGGGIVTPAAKTEFERALELERENLTATLYIGLAAKQAGQREEARRIWEGMVARAPEGAPWVSFVREAIAALGEPAAETAPAASVDTEAAPNKSAELTTEQRDMARGMVERLAARLAENGSDVESWLRLVRSYLVLGERDKARAAATDARRALADDADKLQRLDTGVKALGVEG
ncbi:MAG: c-type cytochrome biogenesis protein CcmI [Rhodoplanes sp.]